MQPNDKSSFTRRSFLQTSAVAASATQAFTIASPAQVRGVGKEMLRLGILGVGMRGSQAVLDTWAGNDNVQLVAIGELFKDRLDGGIANMKQKAPQQFEKKFKVDPEHMFLGFDAYKKVLAKRHRHHHDLHAAGLPPDAFHRRGGSQKAHLLREAVRHRSGQRAQAHGGRQEGGGAEAGGGLGRAAAFA